ncbi:hypothetical protein LN042_12310 [Kitasatospora sp. RB6PN24]|uniref:hypothetical protein n=1 Tax=Kitasatospora humi TaxID=2893891 RepID=UPI001E49BC08|nr:hypothetical protein [Kitasatospora humi]MCC9307866.1 hypothetical protein [Kitasatospora humi]
MAARPPPAARAGSADRRMIEDSGRQRTAAAPPLAQATFLEGIMPLNDPLTHKRGHVNIDLTPNGGRR